MVLTISFPILVALTIAVVEVIKRSGVPKKFLPLIALVVGIIINMLMTASLGTGIILIGIVIGACAAGLFDQTLLVKKE